LRLRSGTADHAKVHVRDASVDDVASITEIFNELIPSRTVIWSERPDSIQDRIAWFERQTADGLPVVVAVEDDLVIGFAAYGEFRDNHKWPGYRFTVELSIHVRQERWGRGAGRALMTALIERARRAGMHVMIAAVDGDNPESLAFHERMGFKAAGRLEQTGCKFGRWLDLVFLQLILQDAPPTSA
jgi:phosphinothricin acetyltransferase